MATNLKQQLFNGFTGAATAAALVMTPMSSTYAQQAQTRTVATTSIAEIDFPMSDARNIGANSVRFAGAQGTEQRPNIVLLGVTRESWPTIRGAIQQSIANGYPVRGVFMGPTDAPPALEIYANGELQTNPINPNTISATELTRLIRDVYAQEYPRTLATRGDTIRPAYEQ